MDSLDHLVEKVKGAVAFAQSTECVDMSETAWALWEHVYGELSTPEPGLSGAILARAEAQVIRLALIYALASYSPQINVEHLQAALVLWRYVSDSVNWIWGDDLTDKVARKILQALREAGPDGLTKRQINDQVFKRNTPSAAIDRALDYLQRRRKVHCKTIATGGRPAQVFLVKS